MTARVRWVAEWDEPGRARFRIGRIGDDLFAEWEGFATLRADRAGVRSEFTPAPGADPRFVAKFHAGLVNALLRHARGEATLHGSGVARNGRALIFIGESRAGKSTAAAFLCRNGGLDLVSDDTAAIDCRSSRLFVTPTETVTWIDADTLAALGQPQEGPRKIPFDPARRASSEAQVVGIVQLVFDDACEAPIVTPLRGQRAFVALARSMIRFVVDDPEVYVRDLDVATRVVHCTGVYEFRRSRSLRTLNSSTAALVQLFEDMTASDHGKPRDEGRR